MVDRAVPKDPMLVNIIENANKDSKVNVESTVREGVEEETFKEVEQLLSKATEDQNLPAEIQPDLIFGEDGQEDSVWDELGEDIEEANDWLEL